METVDLPDSLISIGYSAFQGCSKLNGIIIPENVEDIGAGAFYDCISLTKINIPEKVNNIGTNPFNGCSKLSAIEVDSNNSYFASEAGVLYNKDKTRLICYSSQKQETEYSIPNNTTVLDRGAFKNALNLNKITLNKVITNIGVHAFYRCLNLQDIEIPNTLKIIQPETFVSCQSFKNVVIPEGVTSLGSYAFEWCTNLESIGLPNTMTNIDSCTFYGCSQLNNITYNGTIEQWNNVQKSSSWLSNSKIKTITCTDRIITL